MNRPWPLAALVAALFAVPSSAQVPTEEGPGLIFVGASDAAIVDFFTKHLVPLPPSRVGEKPKSLMLFQALLANDKEAYSRHCSCEVPLDFDILVKDAKALEDAIVDQRHAEIEAELWRPNKDGIASEDRARLDGVVNNAQASAAGWMNSVRFQVGAGPSEDGYTNFGGGAMVRFAYGSEKAGSIGVQGGAIGAVNGATDQLLHREMIDRNRPWERDFEVWEETRRKVSGLGKVRLGGVSYVSPKIGGRVSLEAGMDIGYASLDTSAEVVRETYIHEFVRLSNCYDGICEDWRTRTLSREVLHRGAGVQDRAWGNTVYGAANVQVGHDSPWSVRVEVAKDRFKAFPEASGMTYSLGGDYNIGK
ncbi:MAG: hypothetical protein HY925_11160 [Elusimicrobia bacterium]|nr:hypothetical protein [Elusimicrobiota bacterium]